MIVVVPSCIFRVWSLCLLLLLVHVKAKEPTNLLQDAIDQYQCDYRQDECKASWQVDGECDISYGCKFGDCWDCDPCQALDYTTCDTCVQHGCHWCPTDGTCRTQAIEADFWHNKRVQSSCGMASDWQATCPAPPESNVFSDPLYDTMAWSYKLINIEEVWKQGITGAGVHVRINDVGMDVQHPELQGRIASQHNCPSFESDSSSEALHGTGVASVLAANADNGDCAVGMAPNVTLSACTFREDFVEPELVDMLDTQLQAVDISSNSWGPEVCTNLNFIRSIHPRVQDSTTGTCLFDETHEYSPCPYCTGQTDTDDNDDELSMECSNAIDEYCTYYYQNDPLLCAEFLDLYISCEYHSLPAIAHQAFVRGVVEGRQGKGIVYVFAGGNSHDLGAVTNTDGFINTRFTIAVGAVNKNGTHASYSTTGSALHVTAPGGDLGSVSNMVVAKPGGGCHQITGGTSFSAPVVSAVVALMLQVNPQLTWRDVQSILAHTSQQADPTDDSWTINGAGLHHSYKYGFGIVDAAAAVQAAQNWTHLGPERQSLWRSQNGNFTIADSELVPTVDAITVETANRLVTESVVLYLDLLHASRGDLLITLTSPAGTSSILHPSKRPENRQLAANETWKLMTVRNWGEDSAGEWKLTIVDEAKGIRSECANEPFEHLYLNQATGHYEAYTCLNAEERGHCWNGIVKQAQLVSEYVDRGRNNLTAAEACCFCGGGTPVSEVNLLKSWTLVIYGHDSPDEQDDTDNDEEVLSLTTMEEDTILDLNATTEDTENLNNTTTSTNNNNSATTTTSNATHSSESSSNDDPKEPEQGNQEEELATELEEPSTAGDLLASPQSSTALSSLRSSACRGWILVAIQSIFWLW